jgi:hypothetical protein
LVCSYAFVIVIAYQNLLDADANVSREADSLSSIVRDSAAFPDPGGENVRRAVLGLDHAATSVSVWRLVPGADDQRHAERVAADTHVHD